MACDERLPADCIECQMHKFADGLLSRRYSHPANYANFKPENDDAPVFQAGIKPTGFKALIGKGHEEFSMMRQQDSEEFLTHLLTVLRRDAHKHKERADPDATAVFSYGMEQTLQCGECKKVRYSVDSMDVVSVPLPVKETGKDAEGKTRYEAALGLPRNATWCGGVGVRLSVVRKVGARTKTKQVRIAPPGPRCSCKTISIGELGSYKIKSYQH
ncbi:hypothetical protein BDZ89DRAFT_1068325 [Hymenopellis radicata]|nr:hypothetical protein BDZ89DRAFT_1068325 [Hymenopellis radicata]